MDPQTLTAIAAAVGILLLGMLLMGSGDSNADKRIKKLANASKGEKDGLLSFMKAEDNSSRRKQIEESLSDIEKRQKDKKKQNKSLKARLIQANWSMSPQTFMVIAIVFAAFCGGMAFMFKAPPLLFLGLTIGLGLGLPIKILLMAVARRQKKFTDHFADAMDIIVRGVRTGLPLNDCLKIIAHESPEPLAGEFLRVVEAEGLGIPIEVCLERMYERMPLSEVNFFATVLNIQKTTGGNLGESLSNLANVLRGRKLLREKIKSLSAEAKMSAIIIGFLPIGVMTLITIVAPDYMSELYTTPTGHRNLMIGAGMMVAGTTIMRKMINFKF